MLASTMMGGAALLALTAAPAIMLLAPTVASAQDYTSGTLTGTVQTTGATTVSGATVVVKSDAQGFTRTAVTDGDGQFRIPLLPAGAYTVSVSGENLTSLESTVRVTVGAESDFTFTVQSTAENTDASNIEDIVVTGVRAELDFTQTTKGATIDIAELVKQIPVGRDITSVTLLAPTVVTGSGDVNFRGQPSIGGSTIAENAFYLNGLNITDFDTYVGGSTVPFDFYQTVEVKTGGYPAEYGRATGGVINAVSKSGTNEFMFGLHANYQPSALDENSPDVENSGIHTFNTRREIDNVDYTVEAGGPIIRDRLFAYGLYQYRDLSDYRAYDATYSERTTDSPFYGAKIDGYITDAHHLEFTYFDSESEQLNRSWGYDGESDTILDESPSSTLTTGGESYIAKYTGNLTDWLTISAAYGVNRNQSTLAPEDTTTSHVTDNRYTVLPDPETGGTRSGFARGAQKTIGFEAQDTEREFYRIDADVYFSLFGDHHVRAGIDNEDNTLNHVNAFNGGRRYILRQGAPCAAVPGANPPRPADPTGLTCAFGVAAGDELIQVAYQRLGGLDIGSNNQSYYIQDAWDLTPDLSIQLGLRNDSFLVTGLGNEDQIDLDDNWGPRLGFTWDPFGNGQSRVYGSYGRYFIPPASNLAFRGADYGFSEYYRAAGADGNVTFNGDIPILGAQITAANNPGFEARNNVVACPTGGFGVEGTVACTITLGRGIPERAFSKTSQGLEATNEDEFVLGYEYRANDLWSFGAAVTHRKLNKVSEDITLDSFVVQYCEDNGFDADACAATWDGGWQYVIINPGEDIDIYSRGALPGDANPTCFGPVEGTPTATNCGTLMHFSAEDLGYPKPKREYLGLELTFERAFDGKWGLQGSYVLSRSVGNYEGTVVSDAGGTTQDDAGSTFLFDYPGLSDYQDGPLPNHRLHQFKLFGSYQVTNDLLIGANARVLSPKKYSCLGVHPTDNSAGGYGSVSRFCAGDAAPRGTRMETEWISNVDLSLRYTVPQFSSRMGNLVLRADVFNVFNFQRAEELDEVYDDDGVTMLPTYGSPWAYQQPRYVRLGFDLTF